MRLRCRRMRQQPIVEFWKTCARLPLSLMNVDNGCQAAVILRRRALGGGDFLCDQTRGRAVGENGSEIESAWKVFVFGYGGDDFGCQLPSRRCEKLRDRNYRERSTASASRTGALSLVWCLFAAGVRMRCAMSASSRVNCTRMDSRHLGKNEGDPEGGECPGKPVEPRELHGGTNNTIGKSVVPD